VRILSEEILVIAKVPALNRRLRNAEELAGIHWCSPWRRDGEREVSVGVGVPSSLAAVDRRVDFEAYVEVLAGEMVDLVRREDATESRTGA